MGRTYNLKNVIYFPDFNCIGGIETFCYEFGLKFGKDYDITILYEKGDADMMRKIAEVARVIKYRDGDKIICDTFFFGYRHQVLDYVEAKRIIQFFHSDFAYLKICPLSDDRITDRFGVSDNTTNGVKEKYAFAENSVTMYNPYTPKKPRKVLNLISATRLTREKGLNRMKSFADLLDKAGIPFHWDIYTDVPRPSFNKSVSVLEHRLDVVDFVAKADYLVQLSDTEGYSYSVVEALCVGTPVIVTDCPVLREIGVVDGKNGFILPFDLSDVPMDKIYKGLKKFEYAPPESRYDTVLSKGKCKYEEERPKTTTIRCKHIFFDIEQNRTINYGEEWEVPNERAEKLLDLNLVEIV